MSQSLEERIRFAIKHKRLIEVRYKGSPRIGEPHDYGIQKGVERLFVFSSVVLTRLARENGVGWRLLDTAKIEGCEVHRQMVDSSS